MRFTHSWWIARLATGAVATAAITAAMAPAAAYAATGQTITVTGVADKIVVDTLSPNAPDTFITQLHVAGRAVPAPTGSTVADGSTVTVTLHTTQPMTAAEAVTSATVPNWIHIPNPGSCNMTTVLNSVLAAGIPATTGITDHLLMYFPRRSDCPWAGLGSVGGSYIWDNGYQMTDVISHEFGHNIGLGHANKAKCTAGGLTVPLSTTCTVQEYGDYSDVMGVALGRAPGNLNGALADYLGLSDTVVATPGQTTDVDLAPLGSGPAPTVRIDTTTGPVFVDFRPYTGVDTRDSTIAGVQVRQLVMAGGPATPLLNNPTAPPPPPHGAPLVGGLRGPP